MARLYSHFYRVIQDIQGNIVPGVQGTITLADTPTLAVLYGDPEGTIPLPNPLFNSTQYGSFSVYLDTGHYDMSFLKEGYVFEPLQDIQISEASGGVASLVGTPNRVLVSASTGDITLSAPQDLHPDASLQFAHLGLGTPANGSLGLLCATGSTFQMPMNATTITASGFVTSTGFVVNDHAGDSHVSFYSLLNIAGGTNRWAIYAGGDAPSHLQGSLTVATGLTTSTLNVSSNAAIAGSLQVSGTVTGLSNMQVNGQSTLTGSVGIWRGPDPTYALVTAGQVYVGGAFNAIGATLLGSTLYVTGSINTGDPVTTRVNLGLQSMALQPHTSVQIVGGTVDGLGSLSAGAAPAAGFIATFGGSVHVSNLLGVRTTVPVYPVDVAGGLRASSIASGLFTPGQWNYDLGGNSVYAHDGLGVGVGATARSFQLQITGGAGKPGGGGFADSSYRDMKTAIEAIPDALGLLLSQQGRQYEWTEATRAALLPGVRYGFIEDEVTLPQWREETLDGKVAIAANGFEALCVEALRAIVDRLETLEGRRHA